MEKNPEKANLAGRKGARWLPKAPGPGLCVRSEAAVQVGSGDRAPCRHFFLMVGRREGRNVTKQQTPGKLESPAPPDARPRRPRRRPQHRLRDPPPPLTAPSARSVQPCAPRPFRNPPSAPVSTEINADAKEVRAQQRGKHSGENSPPRLNRGE